MADNSHARIDFTLSWTSFCAKHNDTFHLPDVDLSQDIFPGDFREKLANLDIGESYSETFSADVLLGANHTIDKIKRFSIAHFNTNVQGQIIEPKLFRFFPSIIACDGLKPSKEEMFNPFRIISIENEIITADTNHPLSKYFLTLSATIVDKFSPESDKPSPIKNIGKLVSAIGPGLQVPFEFGDTSFFDTYPLTRENEELDSIFYKSPRMVHHIDESARSKIEALYDRLLKKDDNILDFMSSWESHLSNKDTPSKITGLGLNEEELSSNKTLDEYVIHDANMNQILPFEDKQFDAAICTSSIEYLTYPLKIMTEIARIIKPGGKFVVTFSERWFPEKAIHLWSHLHPFERMQLVLEYFRDSDLFEDLNTFSSRGLTNPKGDKDRPLKHNTDPVYAVWGTVKKQTL